LVGQDARSFVVIEREDAFRSRADGKHRTANDRRGDALETAAVQGELRFEDWTFVVHHRPLPGGYGVQRAGGLRWRHPPYSREALSDALRPQRGIRVQDYVLRAFVSQE